jgi:protein SCO1/2
LGLCLCLCLVAACAPAPDAEEPAGVGAPALDAVRTPPILQPFDLGGDFVLAAHDGTTFDLTEHRGEVFLMFFGYTHCPDFCPATLSLLNQVYELLGEDGSGSSTLLVSIDPARDTPEALAKYLGYFGVPALGLGGTTEEIETVLSAYAGLMESGEDEEGEVAFGHTTYIYLIDHEGNVRYMFRPNDTALFIAAGVKQQIEIARGQN